MAKVNMDDTGPTITLDDGSELAVTAYDRSLISGLAGDLEDGATFRLHDGSTVTRRGEEAVWETPAAVFAAAAKRRR